jgi:hypothetical protein
MSRKLTDEACKHQIKFLARKLGVEPKLIVTKLMSEEDKDDMCNGLLPYESLECHVKVWIEAGMADYAHGDNTPMKSPPVEDGRLKKLVI